jgi:hypothetical protein
MLVKHCTPDNRCGWVRCDLSCGYQLDMTRGVATVLLRRRAPGVDSARGDGEQD